ncbi:MAG: cytidylyltransferase domain-containing protein [Sarcina sp.]
MYNNKRVLAIIPARAGSKGIKDKNIIDLNGKPLIAYSIEQGLDSNYIDKVLVSTDGEKIAKIAKQYGAKVPFLRPKHIAGDEAKTIDVMLHAIEFLGNNKEVYDYVVLLQPTQPLRTGAQIDEAIEALESSNSNGLVSVSKVKEHPILMRTINNGKLHNLLNVSSTVRRQDMAEYYKVNGVIYINKINNEFNKNTSLNDNELPYIIDEKFFVDIDDLFDLEIAKIAMNNRLKNK